MSYTPPAGNAANFSWVGVAAYTPPAGGAANFSWVTDAAPEAVSGDGAGALAFTGASAATHGIAGAGAGTLGFTGVGIAEHQGTTVEGVGAGTLEFAGAATANHGITGAVAGTLAFAGAGAAAHGIAAAGNGAIAFGGACMAVHQRYEVRGEVRLSNVLVNRRVRCYKRATGVLTGQADTVVGKYRVHAGFDAGEVYVTAIDLADAATDWIPPVANRLVPVLADDTA